MKIMIYQTQRGFNISLQMTKSLKPIGFLPYLELLGQAAIAITNAQLYAERVN